MMFAIAKMPYEMAMKDELSRRQFYANTQRLVAALEAARDEVERLREMMEEREQRDEALLRQVLEVLSCTHQTAMEQAMKARVLEGVVFAEIFQDLDFVVAALRERLGEGAKP